MSSPSKSIRTADAILQNKKEAEDAVQNAFVPAMHHFPSEHPFVFARWRSALERLGYTVTLQQKAAVKPITLGHTGFQLNPICIAGPSVVSRKYLHCTKGSKWCRFYGM